MLVLSRRLKQRILIPCVQMAIEIVAIKPGLVRLGIQAPATVTVLREEVPNRSSENLPHPGTETSGTEGKLKSLLQLVRNRLIITGKGLEQAQNLLQKKAPQGVGEILANIQEDLRLLQERLQENSAKKETTKEQSGKIWRALLVEDDQNERELLASLLRMSGVEVETAVDGLDALKHLESTNRPDVVLMDMGLPRCDGAATVRKIRGEPAWAGLKIFAVSGSSPDQFNLAKGSEGIDRWFQKPIDSAALLRDLTNEIGHPVTVR